MEINYIKINNILYPKVNIFILDHIENTEYEYLTIGGTTIPSYILDNDTVNNIIIGVKVFGDIKYKYIFFDNLVKVRTIQSELQNYIVVIFKKYHYYDVTRSIKIKDFLKEV